MRHTKTHCIVGYASYDYDIEWTRLDTPLKLVGWTRHLTGKRWMNPVKLKQFMEYVADYHKWDIDDL